MRKRTLKRKREARGFPLRTGAGDESRTRDLNLGKVALYQLSYSRIDLEARSGVEPLWADLQSAA